MPGSTSGQQASSQGSRQQQGREGKDQGAEAKWVPIRPQFFTESVRKWKGSASSWAVKESSPEVKVEEEEEQEDEDPHEEAEEEQRTQVPAPKRQAFLPPQKKKRSGAEHRQRGQRGSKRLSIIRPR